MSTSGKINASIKSAYRNYFADAKDFTTYIIEGIKILNERFDKIWQLIKSK